MAYLRLSLGEGDIMLIATFWQAAVTKCVQTLPEDPNAFLVRNHVLRRPQGNRTKFTLFAGKLLL